jgi:hypothetical protein
MDSRSNVSDSTRSGFFFPEMCQDARWVPIGRNLHLFRGEDAWQVHYGLEQLFVFSANDRGTKKLCMAQLSVDNLAKDVEIAGAFGCSRQTVYLARQAFLKKGFEGLAPKRTGPKGPHTTPSLEKKMLQLRRQGASYRAIAKECGVSATRVRLACLRNGLVKAAPESRLPFGPASAPGDGCPPCESAEASQDKPSQQEHGCPPPQEEAPCAGEGACSVESSARVETVPTPAEALASGERARTPNVETTASTETASASPETPHVLEEAQDLQEECPLAATPSELPTEGNGWEGAAREVAPGEPAPARTLERILASLGKLGQPEVLPEFVTGGEVPAAGTLLAFALLAEDGAMEVARETYGRLSNGFYGLRSLILTLLACAMLGVKTLDSLQHGTPHHWGRLLGLDRLPETKTVRRKFNEIAQRKKAAEFMRQMAKRRIQAGKSLRMVLYFDSHARAYYGKRRVGKRHMNRFNQSKKAVIDYWAHDGAGAPLLKICGPVDASLVRMIREVVAEVRPWISAQTPLILVFDREGWSPELFQELRKDHVWVLTYRKGKVAPYPEKDFEQIVHFPKEPGRPEKTYQVRDRSVSLGEDSFRSVTVLRDDGQQTEIITADLTAPTAQVLREMFSRWGGENDFKYRRAHGQIDRLGSYQFEPVPEDVRVRNPAHTRLDQAVKQARERRKELLVQVAEAGESQLKPSELEDKRRELTELEPQIATLKAQRRQTRKHIRAGDLPPDQRPEQPNHERKLFSDVIAISADRIERRLHGLLAPHYKSSYRDGRELLRQVYRTPGDFVLEGNVLQVTLNALASPHQTRALAGLCEEVNALGPEFPETRIALRFKVHPHPGEQEMSN